MNPYFIFFISLFYSIATPASPGMPDQITYLPGYGALTDVEYAGYLPVSDANCGTKNCDTGRLFYWYVEQAAKQADAPIVLWLNGGPGASSMYGFFMEHGPYSVDQEMHLIERPYSWAKKVNYLVIDQPEGVGFSYEGSDSFSNESEAMDQLYYALQKFFQYHPELAQKSVYLAGQSYAGKYLPQLAIRMISEQNEAQKIPLKGLLIGDGWVNPRLQQAANADFAYSHGLISKKGHQTVLNLYTHCAQEIDKSSPSSREANQACGAMQDFIKKSSGLSNLTNIAQAVALDDGPMIRYLNDSEVRKALHIDPRVGEFKSFSDSVAQALELGEQDSVAHLYSVLLEAGLKVLIYNGLEDGTDSNFMGTDLWLSSLKWAHQKEFAHAKTCVWTIEGDVAGFSKTAAGLTQVKMRQAGHIAPADQPQRAFDLLSRFINEDSFCK